jgi:hypothetical protein
MSRKLPTHPNLDHLRKQAKDRLHDLQERNPRSKLSDAQHAIAREYGFRSWPKLKTHVESLLRADDMRGVAASSHNRGGGRGGVGVGAFAVPPSNFGIERYTFKARQALFFSRYEAAEAGSATIEPTHLLLGLIHAGQGSHRLFERAHLSLEEARTKLADPAIDHERLSSSVLIPFGEETRQALLHAAEEAERLEHPSIGIAHLLLGILHDERSVAASIMRDHGMPLRVVRDDIGHFLNEESM